MTIWQAIGIYACIGLGWYIQVMRTREPVSETPGTDIIEGWLYQEFVLSFVILGYVVATWPWNMFVAWRKHRRDIIQQVVEKLTQ